MATTRRALKKRLEKTAGDLELQKGNIIKALVGLIESNFLLLDYVPDRNDSDNEKRQMIVRWNYYGERRGVNFWAEIIKVIKGKYPDWELKFDTHFFDDTPVIIISPKDDSLDKREA
jgi:hypothetical protein